MGTGLDTEISAVGRSANGFEHELRAALDEGPTRVVDALLRLARRHPEREAEIRRAIAGVEPDGADGTGGAGGAPAESNGVIGLYRILQILGEGGMGTVFLAEQVRPFPRKVALKIVKQGVESESARARFTTERDALARMSHDNIARVYDVGTNERGQPYFVMEYVRGLPIHEHCDRHRLTIEERVQLMIQVCAGVQHAHQKGIVHRDLKPSNILICAEQRRPKIIDFGVARAGRCDRNEVDALTGAGQVIGTLGYMAPEQADGRILDVDSRVDVYSLGVVLHQLLVGELPIPVKDVGEVGFAAVQQRICQQEPPRPSAAVARAAAARAPARSTTAKGLRTRLRGDLDWIVRKALEKDPIERYGTANELAADLQRWLDREPVTATPPRLASRWRRFVTRHYAQLAAGFAVCYLLLAGCLWLLWLEAEQQAAQLTQSKWVNASVLEEARSRELQARAAAHRDLDRLRLLALAPMLESAERERQAIGPPWPDSVAPIRAWLEAYAQPMLDARLVAHRSLADPGGPAGGSADGTGFPWLHNLADQRSAGLAARVLDFTDAEDGAITRMRRRLSWAESIEQRSVLDRAGSWRQVAARIATDGRFRGLALAPQLGLVPHRDDPLSGLPTFVHLYTCDEDAPAHGGVVFTLIPGEPGHAARFVALEPLTERQWRRLCDQPVGDADGERPVVVPDGHALDDRLESLGLRRTDWSDRELVERVGLRLPDRGILAARDVR